MSVPQKLHLSLIVKFAARKLMPNLLRFISLSSLSKAYTKKPCAGLKNTNKCAIFLMNFLDEIDIDIVSFMNILFIVDMH